MSNFYSWLFGSKSNAVAMDETRKVYRLHPDGSPCYAEKEEDCPLIQHHKKAEEADNLTLPNSNVEVNTTFTEDEIYDEIEKYANNLGLEVYDLGIKYNQESSAKDLNAIKTIIHRLTSFINDTKENANIDLSSVNNQLDPTLADIKDMPLRGKGETLLQFLEKTINNLDSNAKTQWKTIEEGGHQSFNLKDFGKYEIPKIIVKDMYSNHISYDEHDAVPYFDVGRYITYQSEGGDDNLAHETISQDIKGIEKWKLQHPNDEGVGVCWSSQGGGFLDKGEFDRRSMSCIHFRGLISIGDIDFNQTSRMRYEFGDVESELTAKKGAKIYAPTIEYDSPNCSFTIVKKSSYGVYQKIDEAIESGKNGTTIPFGSYITA